MTGRLPDPMRDITVNPAGAPLVLRKTHPEGREGMVTVYDHQGRYLGCMGIETWHGLLAAGPAERSEDG